MICHTCRKPFTLVNAVMRTRLKQKGLPYDAPNDSLYCGSSCGAVGAIAEMRAAGKAGGRKPNKTGNAIKDEWELRLHNLGLGMDRGARPDKLVFGYDENPDAFEQEQRKRK